MFLRGDIYYCDLGKDNLVGSEQRGTRPVLIIQNDIGNKFSSTVIVAMITTKDKNVLPTHVDLYNYPRLQPKCTVLLEQIRTVDKIRLRDKVTTVSPDDMRNIDKAILISQGIDINKLVLTEV